MNELSRKFFGLLAGGWALGISALASAQVPTESGYGPPRDVSVDGHRIDWLIDVTNVFIGILFVIMVVWMVWAVFVHNERHTAEYDHGSSRHAVTIALVISALIFFIVDGNLFYHSTKDLSEAFWNYERHGGTGAVRIEVNARQWIWQARYAGPDGRFNTQDDALTVNDVRVPVNTPVMVQLGSPDVIHNFYLPNFRVKMDAVPGTVNVMVFEAKETGQFEIACAQHCGVNHYKMRGVLTVLPKEEFDRWAAQVSTDSAAVYLEEDEEAHWGWDWKKI